MIEKTVKWPLVSGTPLAQWTSGRIVILGDAAHVMLPYMSQVSDRLQASILPSLSRNDTYLGIENRHSNGRGGRRRSSPLSVQNQQQARYQPSARNIRASPHGKSGKDARSESFKRQTVVFR
jgi:hypothetical protein